MDNDTERAYRRVRRVAASAVLALTCGLPSPAQDDLQDHELLMHQIEMGSRVELPRSDADVSDETARKFEEDYFADEGDKRAVFDEYLPQVGAAWILDFLEKSYPLCHGQSHELGRALVAHLGDVDPSIRACGTRCTSGCMHGVLMGAFGGTPADCAADDEMVGKGMCHSVASDDDIEKIVRDMDTFCREGDMAVIHKVGNCAHGVGHAVMTVSGHDAQKALDACALAREPALGYYCATGVFMEMLVTGIKEDFSKRDLHYPCDTYTRYPAACYRYKMGQIRRHLEDDVEKVVAECTNLSDASLRLGCFHGLGATHMLAIVREPVLLADVCLQGSVHEQAVCIEGAMEKLGDFNEEKALGLCRRLLGTSGEVCEAAVMEKMYRLDKPTMHLYTGVKSSAPATEAPGASPATLP